MKWSTRRVGPVPEGGPGSAVGDGPRRPRTFDAPKAVAPRRDVPQIMYRLLRKVCSRLWV